MGIGCCMKVDLKKQEFLLMKAKQAKEQELAELKQYYKINKPLMQQKIRPIYKKIVTVGNYEPDSVNLNFVSFAKTKAEYLLKLIPYMCNVKILKLWKSNLGSEGMKIIGSSLYLLHNLEVLSLEDNSLGPEGCKHLGTSLGKLERLKELWLHINDIGAVGAMCIAECLGNLKKLEKLGLDENMIENKGALKIISIVKDFKNIKMIGLGYNMISEDACLNLAVMLATAELEKLVLTGNTLGETAYSRMVTLLPRSLIIF